MLTIYGVYRSRAIRPLWVLAEAGIAYEHVPVIQAFRLADPKAADAPPNTAQESYLAINPLGQVPALRDGTLTLTESMAICLHIARKYGGTIGPLTDDEASLMEQWALFAATAVEPAAIEILYAQSAPEPDSPTNTALVRVAAEKLRRPLARLEGHLAGRDHLLDRFSVADIIIADCLRYAQGHAPLLAEFPHSARWLAACQARAAYQKIWAIRQAEPA